MTYESILGVILELGACPIWPKETRSIHKTGEGAGSNQMMILEQGAQTILKWSMEEEKDPGARREIKREQGALKNEKGARKKVKKGQEVKN